MTPESLYAYREARDAGKTSLAKRLLSALVAAEDALVRRCARKLARSASEEDDLVQAGRMGLLTAIEKFDPERGAWTQYAKQWIFNSMHRGVVDLRSDIRLPIDKAKEVRALRRQIAKTEKTLGRRVTAEDLGVASTDLWDLARAPSVCEPVEDQDKTRTSGGRPTPPRIMLIAPAEHPTILTPAFWRALACLTAQEARVLTSLVVDERGVKEVAESEGHEERWARSTLKRALEKMRSALAV